MIKGEALFNLGNMGRLKKGHNWKARLQVTVAKSGTPPQPEMKSEAVVVERDEMKTSYKTSADDSNHFVIPRKKENSKKLKVQEKRKIFYLSFFLIIFLNGEGN